MVALAGLAGPVLIVGGPRPATADEPAVLCVPGANPITGLKTTEKVVTFTFDDGPSPTYTRPIMDAFEARGMRATFFLVSGSVRNRPELVLEMAARGHELGNHSRTHHYTSAINVKEMPIAQRHIEDASGVRPQFFRMPGLAWGRKVVTATGVNGLCAIDTNFIVGDWKSPRASAVTLCDRFKKNLKPGSLVVLHDGGRGHGPTVTAVPCMLDYAIAQGYQVLGLSDFLALASTGQATLTFRKVK